MIQISEVTVVGADASVLSWPVKARLESIGIVPNKMQIRTTGTAHWQPVDINASQDSSGDGNPTNDPDQGGTLWVFECIGGKWYASGAERLRPGQLNGDKPVADPSQGGLSTLIGNGWLYDANRWGAMAGVNPKAGDLVGFMIASGSSRLDTTSRERERTDVVVCRWPDAAGRIPFEEVWREGAAVPDAPPVTPPSIPAPPVDDSWRGAFSDLSRVIERLAKQNARHIERLDALEGANTATNARIDAVGSRVTALEQKPDPVAQPSPRPSGYIVLFGQRIPVRFE